MAAVLETNALGKRYGKKWALKDCTLSIPARSITGLVGLNGAGKTTLIHLVLGLIEPSAGSVEVLGQPVSAQNERYLLPRIGFVAQRHSLYQYLSVKEILKLGSKLNPRWDDNYARALLSKLQIPLKIAIHKLSGGQQAQLALLMALAKKPALLLLDEPFANVDPLARQAFIQILLEAMTSEEMTVLLSSHIIADLDKICDELIILSKAQVQIAGNIENLLSTHKRLIGPREGAESIERMHTVLQASHTGRQSHLLVKANEIKLNPSWQVQDVSLEDIVLAYLALQQNSQEPLTSKEEVLR